MGGLRIPPGRNKTVLGRRCHPRFASNGNLMYSTRTRIGKLGESQGRKVTGLREESYGRQTAEGSCERWGPAIAFP